MDPTVDLAIARDHQIFYSRLELIGMNCIVPFVFAIYAMYKFDENISLI